MGDRVVGLRRWKKILYVSELAEGYSPRVWVMSERHRHPVCLSERHRQVCLRTYSPRVWG